MTTSDVEGPRMKEEMGLAGRLYNFFLGSTSSAVASLRARVRWTDWFVPILVTFVVTAAVGRVTRDIVVSEVKERLRSNPALTEEQIQQAIDRMEQQQEKWSRPHMQVLAYLISFVVVFAITAIVGGIVLFITDVILGGEARYVHALSLAAWGSWLVHMGTGGGVTLIGLFPALVKTPLILAKGSTDVTTSLAILWSGSKASFVYQLLSKVDIFNIWLLAVMSVGIAVLAKVETKRAAVWVVGLWAIVAVLSAAASAFLLKVQGMG